MIFFFIFILCSIGIGSALLTLLKIKLQSDEHLFISSTIGLAVLSLATLSLGLIGLNPLFFKVLFIITLLVTLPYWYKSIAFLRHVRTPLFSLKTFLVLFIAGLALANFIAASAPPSSSDAISYHLAMPKLFISHGSITSLPSIIPSYYPLGTEMLYLDALLLDGGVLAELIAAYIALLTAGNVYLVGRRWSELTGILAAAIFYSLPLVSVYNVRGFVDISAALYATAGTLLLLDWLEHKRYAFLFVAGFLFGASAVTKISAYPIPLIMGIALLHRATLQTLLKRALLYSSGVLIVITPWIARTTLLTHNPVYPLFYSLFGGPYVSERLAQFWVEESLAFVGFGTSITALFMLPWNVTMYPTAFNEAVSVGPLLLMAVPLVIFINDKKILALLAASALLFIVWFYTAQSLRYIFFGWALLSIIASYALTHLTQRTKIVALALTGAVLMIHVAIWAGANYDEVFVATGVTDKETFLSEHVTNYDLLMFTNTLPSARLCLFGEIRGYYSEHDYIWCNPAFQGYVNFFELTTSQELHDTLKHANVTHVVWDGSIEGAHIYHEAQGLPLATQAFVNAQTLMSEFLNEHGTLIYESERGRVYEVTYD